MNSLTDVPLVFTLSRWRLRLARVLLSGRLSDQDCPRHYDECGYPNSNISGCIWCALEIYHEEVSRLLKENDRLHARLKAFMGEDE